MSTDFTFGVEEEYQLIDPVTGAMRSRSHDVLGSDWTGDLRKEMQESTVEIGTVPCASAEELRADLSRLRFQTATAAASLDLEIVAAGTHPFTRWEGQQRTADERYAHIEEQYRQIAREEHKFGMHIHVGIPERLDRIALMNRVRFFLPHLLALAASSPFYEGEDTGYASWRSILWRRWPNAGVPPRFDSTQEYRRFVDLLLKTRAIRDEKNLYWSIRPHPTYPTLEFRVTDCCLRIDDAVAIATFARMLVIGLAEGILGDDAAPSFSPAAEHALLSANEWRAARYGIDAWLSDAQAKSGITPLRDSIAALVERLGAGADAIGDGAALAQIGELLERGTAADRMRRVFAERGGFSPLVDWMAAETLLGTGMDRRLAQRAEEEVS